MLRIVSTLSLSVALIGALTACGDSSKDDTSTTEPTTSGGEDDTADTATGGGSTNGLKTVEQLTISAEIAWDADSATAGSYTFYGYEFGSAIYVNFATGAWSGDPAEEDEYCTVMLDITGQGNADWAAGEGQLVGLDYAGGEVTGDCADFDTAAVFGGYTAEEVLGQVTWSIGMGGALDPDVETLIVDALGEEALEIFGGGYFASDLVQNPYTDVYVQALELDPSRELVVGDDGAGVNIPVVDWGDSSGLVSGLYLWDMAVSFGFSR